METAWSLLNFTDINLILRYVFLPTRHYVCNRNCPFSIKAHYFNIWIPYSLILFLFKCVCSTKLIKSGSYRVMFAEPTTLSLNFFISNVGFYSNINLSYRHLSVDNPVYSVWISFYIFKRTRFIFMYDGHRREHLVTYGTLSLFQ